MPIPNHLYGKKLTEEQKAIIHATGTHKVIGINANAGTGKTFLITAIAKMLNKPLHYIFFPTYQELGLLPGSLREKEDPFLLPLKDALTAMNEKPEESIHSHTEFRPHAWVHASSHIYWRGGNIENSVVFLDEAQNATKHQIKKMLTRCHDSNLVFIAGHDQQCDMKNPSLSGFVPYLKHMETTDLATVCTLSKNFRGKISTWADQLDI